MDISTMIILAIVSVLTALIVALRVIPWRILMQYHWAADIAFTLALMFLLKGSMTGMIIAIISGLIFSIVLTLGKVFTPKPKG